MKRRILSIICALALCLTLLPATALAVEGYDFTLSEESLDFGTVSLASNPSKTVTITNSGTENIIVQLKTYKNPNTYFVLNGNPEEYEVKQDWSAGGIGYYEATVLPGDSVNVDVQVNYTKLTDTESMDYDGTITFPVYKADGSTPINKEIAAKFNWVTAKQAMEVTETSLNLGTVGQGYGDTQPVTFTITNTGQLKLDVVHCNLSFDEDQGADEKYYVTSFFKLTPNIFIPAISGSEYKFLSLEAGKTADIGVYVKQGLPQGTYRATLVVDGYNYLAETYVYAYIPLTFTVGAAQYSISADPATLDFGTAGLSNTQAEAQTVTITNTGNTVDTITLPSADNFEITAGDGFSGSTATISQGRTASFTVQPKAGLSEGNYNTAITVTSTHSASTTVNLHFKVERKDCDLMANVSQLDFGYEQEGYDQPEGKTVTLTNVGKNTLTVSLPTAENYVLEGGDGFSGNTATIASDGTASFTVCPATGLGGGSHPAALTITGKSTSGEEKASWTVNLNFSVEPKVYAASVSPETVTFDGLRVGYEQPEAQTVTVTNTGNQALSLKLPSLEDYEIQAATGFDEEGVASLAVNGKASFTVRPAAGLEEGNHSATLTLKLTSDDPEKTVKKEVALNCSIDETALEANPASYDFGTVQGSNYQVAERLTVTISVKSGVNGEYKIKIPANDPVFIFEPRDNFVLDEDGQFYTGTVKRVTGNVTQIAAFYLSVRNDLSPGNYDRELDLGCGLTLHLKFKVEAVPYEITVLPQQLDFGTIVSGVDKTPAAQMLTVTNTGTNTITVNLPSSTNYVVTGGDGFEDGKATVQSGAAASFTVRPKEDLTAKDYEEFLSITTDQNGVSKDILLKFTVETPDYTISCDPASLEFGTITVDETPPEAQTVTITNQGNVTNTVRLPQSNTFDLTGGAGFAGGTAVLEPEETATFTVRPKASLSADNYSGTLTLSGSGDSEVSIEVSYVVEKGQAVVTKAPTAKTLTYTGEAQPLVTKGAATGGTLVYSLDQDGAYTTAIPTATNAGEYSVYYKVQGDKDHNDTEPVEVTVTIAKADPKVTAPVPVTGLTYTGEEYELITAGTTTGGTLVYSLDENGEYTDTIPTGTAAQSYTVWYKVQGNENYNDTEAASVTAVIGNALAEVTEAPEANTLTYTGQAQALVTAGEATGGDMMYRLGDSGEFSADIPTGTNAGDYSVWYKVVGDENHSDTDPVEVKITIAKATPAYTVPTGLTATYGDTLADVALPDDWAWDDAVTTSVGNVGDNTFSATFTPSDTDNYNTVTKNLTVTVSAKDITGAVITLGGSLTYTGQQQTQQIASVTVDNMTVTYTVSGNTGTDAGDYTLTISGTGNFTGEATQKWSIAKATYTGTTGVSGTVLANWPDKVTLPAIPDGASYVAASYDGSDGAVKDLSIEGGVLSYTGGESITVDQAYKITVQVDGGKNYEDYTITVTLTGSDKQTLTITGVTAQGGAYTGQAQTGYTGSPAADGYDGDFTVTYGTTDGQAPTDAGTYTVTIAIPDSDPQYVGSTTLKFTIAKKALTVSAPSKTIYVGDTIPDLSTLQATVTGLVGEDTFSGVTLAYEGTPDSNTPGTWAIKPSGGSLTIGNTNNYTVSYVNGTLTVEKKPVSGSGTSGGTTTPSGPSTGGSDGWTEIEDEVDETPSGSTVTVDMNGTTEVPAEVFEAVAGKNVTLELDMGGGVKWEINGQDIPTDLDFTDLDLGVSLNTSDIPVDVINMVTGEKSTVQLSLAHDGEFGFTLTLTAPVGTENKGLWANLYHYNTTKKQMLFETSAQVDSSGNVALKFTHASEYAIVLDESSHELPFTDTAKGAWYQGAVEYVYRNGIMTGTSATTFSPNTAMNRAMVAQILYNLEGQPTVTGESTFTDSNTHWAAKAIAWAQKTGVVSGYGNNTFRPNQAVTREELAQMLYNYAEYKQYDLTASGDLIAFPDGNNVQGWAKTAMSWANGNQLINGFEDDTLRPGGDSTRAQAASILMNFDLNVVKD